MPLPKVSFILHFLLNPHEFVGQTFFDVCSLHSEHRFKGILFASKDLHLLFVIVEFVGDVFDLLLHTKQATSRVCSLPFSEAGLDPNELPVSFIFNKNIMIRNISIKSIYRQNRN